MCKLSGLKLAINAAQALGQMPINVATLGADFLCAPSHKWLMGGYGLGVFYARREWHDPAGWPFGGWLSVADADQAGRCSSRSWRTVTPSEPRGV